MNRNRLPILIFMFDTALALIAGALLLLTPAAQAATFTVTTAADSGPGSLRQAILDANATGPEGTSEFPVCFGPTGAVQDAPITGLSAGNDGAQTDRNPVTLTATAR